MSNIGGPQSEYWGGWSPPPAPQLLRPVIIWFARTHVKNFASYVLSTVQHAYRVHFFTFFLPLCVCVNIS